jgi:hypothetical protein
MNRRSDGREWLRHESLREKRVVDRNCA